MARTWFPRSTRSASTFASSPSASAPALSWYAPPLLSHGQGCTGKPLTAVISIGIGGSYLGPEFVYEALRNDPMGHKAAEGRELHFVANVDPLDIARNVEHLDPERTLVVIVSKTFTTAETMLNARSLRRWLLEKLG